MNQVSNKRRKIKPKTALRYLHKSAYKLNVEQIMQYIMEVAFGNKYA